MLSQLSYGPKGGTCSGQLEVFRPSDSTPLIVSRRAKTQMHQRLTREGSGREKVAAVEFLAVRGDEVDFVGGIRTMLVAGCRSPARSTMDSHDIPVPVRGLALNSIKPALDVEHEVIAKATRQGPEDVDAEAGRLMHYSYLR